LRPDAAPAIPSHIVSFFHLLEAGEMPFLQNRFRIDSFRRQASAQRRASPSLDLFSGAPRQVREREHREMAHALRIRAAVNPTQEFLFVQKKIAGQYALADSSSKR